MNKKGEGGLLIFGGLIIIGLIVGGFYFLHSLAPWWEAKTGEAELARAVQNRQITIEEAKAKKESAILLAEAEIERARGVAQANAIIGDSLKGNDEYLRYLYIQAIEQQGNQIIYVPTEAGLPILEANRFKVNEKSQSLIL